MYSTLIDYVSCGDYENALKELEKFDLANANEELCILAASTLMGIGDFETAFLMISKGLQINQTNYELYLLMGQYYEQFNINQAYLCYENAMHFCDKDEDKEVIAQFMEGAKSQDGFSVRNTSFVILSYNTLDMTKRCVESIREHHLPSTYEIVMVDNNSTDGSVDWLKAQSDIILKANDYNAGFPAGCNQGIELSAKDNDIFLLNNDTLMYPNSLFYLRMGLYASDEVGSTSAMTNLAANGQVVNHDFEKEEEYIEWATSINVPMLNPYEKKSYLIGYALLIKRPVLDEVGLLDEIFTPGQFEDNDYGVRILNAGYQNILCHNSFIRHYGSGNGKNVEKWKANYNHNKQLFKDKWNFTMSYYTNTRTDLIDLITHSPEDSFNVLEIGCGFGSTLNGIEYKFPNAKLYGIELMSDVAAFGTKMQPNIIQGNIETMELPYEKGQFDYIIFGDVLEHLHDTEGVLNMLKQYLTNDGCFLCSIPNLMHVSVMYNLCHGKFEYTDDGLLDRTHIHLFTLSSITNMFTRLNCNIEKILSSKSGAEDHPVYVEFINWMATVPGGVDTKLLRAFQFIFRARKV